MATQLSAEEQAIIDYVEGGNASSIDDLDTQINRYKQVAHSQISDKKAISNQLLESNIQHIEAKYISQELLPHQPLIQTKWFNGFPPQCPPSDARNDTLQVFRLVSNNPPTSDDFLSTIREYPHRKFSDEILCNAHGVSVYRIYKDALNSRNKFSKTLGHKKIAVGTITPNDGLVKETFEPSHITWWLQTEKPHKTFREVGNVTK